MPTPWSNGCNRPGMRLVLLGCVLVAGCLSPTPDPGVPTDLGSSSARLAAADAGYTRCWVDRDGDFIAERTSEQSCRSADGGQGEVGCAYYLLGNCPSERQAAPTLRTVYDAHDVLAGQFPAAELGQVSSYWTKPAPDGDATFLDCDDFSAAVSPRLPEAALDGVDNDCDGLIDEHGFLPSESLPDIGTLPRRANVHAISIQINDVATDAWLADPAHPTVIVEGLSRRAGTAASAAVVNSAEVTKVYDATTHVLTVTLPLNVFLPDTVYVLQLLLRDPVDPGHPALGPIQDVSDPLNLPYITLSGTQALGNVHGALEGGLSRWAQAYVLKGLAELVRYQLGETGWAGTLFPNGEKWGAGAGTFQYCNFGPEWMGKQTSAQMSSTGVASALWAPKGSIGKKYRDVALDGECTATGPNCPGGGGVCTVVDPTYPNTPSFGDAIACTTATQEFDWAVRDDDLGVYFADDGLGGQGTVYANASAMDFASWSPGDVEHIQWANGTDWHWAVFLDYAPDEPWACPDGTQTTGVISHLSFNGCGNGVCVTRLGAQCDGYRLDSGAVRKQVVERMHHVSPQTD